MEKQYNTQEALDFIMCSDSEDDEEAPSESDDEDAGTEDEKEYQLESEASSHLSSDPESKRDTEETAEGWSAKNGQIGWSPTKAETVRYILVTTDLVLGPTCYAIAPN